MSEKKVRKLLDIAIDYEVPWEGLDEQRRQVLAEPPDLVELLWRIKARITDCRIKVAKEEYATPFWTHLKATESTLDEMACYINRVFGIRLTEDGEWEYTEER